VGLVRGRSAVWAYKVHVEAVVVAARSATWGLAAAHGGPLSVTVVPVAERAHRGRTTLSMIL
jgi:hypothetical protein